MLIEEGYYIPDNHEFMSEEELAKFLKAGKEGEERLKQEWQQQQRQQQHLPPPANFGQEQQQQQQQQHLPPPANFGQEQQQQQQQHRPQQPQFGYQQPTSYYQQAPLATTAAAEHPAPQPQPNIQYNVEHVFEENGREVRKMPILVNGQTMWVDCVPPQPPPYMPQPLAVQHS